MRYTLEASCRCDIGRLRRNNEDNFFFDGICLEEAKEGTNETLFLERPIKRGICLSVFDGMGGENYGEQASCAAAQKMREFLQTPRAFYISELKYLQEMSAQINTAVVEKAAELVTSRMGTTMAAMYFTPRSVYCINVGDSRLYRLRGQTLLQLSEDQVSTQSMSAGRKAPLTQHLGMDPQEVRLIPYILKEYLQPDDHYLICSDGLTDMVSNEKITDILLKHTDVKTAVNALVEAALECGGRDNITAIVCSVH